MGWVSTLADARRAWHLQAEFSCPGRYPWFVVDERLVGDPVEIDAYTGHEGLLS